VIIPLVIRPFSFFLLAISIQGCVGIATQIPSRDAGQMQVFYATDLGIFQRDIVSAVNRVGIPTSVYASSNDLAPITSSSLSGYPRVRDSSDKVYTFRGIDTIDATEVRQSFLGHSYYRSGFTVIDDLQFLIVGKHPIRKRPGLTRVQNKVQPHWKLL